MGMNNYVVRIIYICPSDEVDEWARAVRAPSEEEAVHIGVEQFYDDSEHTDDFIMAAVTETLH